MNKFPQCVFDSSTFKQAMVARKYLRSILSNQKLQGSLLK